MCTAIFPHRSRHDTNRQNPITWAVFNSATTYVMQNVLNRSVNFQSCIFQSVKFQYAQVRHFPGSAFSTPCYTVRHFPVLHFQHPLNSCPSWVINRQVECGIFLHEIKKMKETRNTYRSLIRTAEIDITFCMYNSTQFGAGLRLLLQTDYAFHFFL